MNRLKHIIDKKFSVRQTETFIKEKKYFNLTDSLIVTARKINQEDINNLQKRVQHNYRALFKQIKSPKRLKSNRKDANKYFLKKYCNLCLRKESILSNIG